MFSPEEVKIELLPSQEAFFNVDDDVQLDFCIYQGGFGSGKTWAGSLLGLCYIQKYAQRARGLVGLVCAKTMPLLENTTLDQYLRHIDDMGLQAGVDYKLNRSKYYITFMCWNNFTLLFKSLDDPNKVRSLNLCFIAVEEASMTDESKFLELCGRLRSNVPRLRFIAHTNPQPTKGWIYKHFAKGEKKTETSPNGDVSVTAYRRVIAPTIENKHLPAHYLANMKDKFSEALYRMNVLGEDVDFTEGLVVQGWGHSNISTREFTPELPLWLTCDFNVDPMCWMIAQYWSDGELHFIDELCLPNITTSQASEEFCRRYEAHKNIPILLCGDATGRANDSTARNRSTNDWTILQNTLSANGFHRVEKCVSASNPAVRDRINAFNSAVCNGLGVRRVFASPKCKRLIWNMENLKYIQGTSEILMPSRAEIERDTTDTIKYTEHPFAAAGYLVTKLMPIKKEFTPKNKVRVGDVPFRGGINNGII